MSKLLLVGIGGFIGACLRYIISGIAYKYLGSNFPWGTLLVNLIGAFAIGFFWQSFENIISSTNLNLFILIGMVGAFTTFSTYSLETINLLKNNDITFALLNILATNILSLVFVFVGIVVSKNLSILISR